MIRVIVATLIWIVTAVLSIAMFWTLTAGGFLAAMADGEVAIDETLLALSYIAIGSIVAVSMAYATVGLLLATRTGGGRVGAVLLVGGLSFAAIPFGWVVGGTLVLHDPLDPFASAVFLLGPACIPIGYSMILPVLALVFPHGRLPSRRWRLPAGLVAAAIVGSAGIRILSPGQIAGTNSRSPFGVTAMPTAVAGLADALAGVGILAVSVLGVAAVLVRYRRGSIVERQQLRWFAGAVLLAAIPIAITPQPGIGGPMWLLLASVGLLLVPVSVGIAVTRYRLYEIDRLISRGLSWAVLTALLLAVYAGAILVLQAVFGDVTQGNTVVVAASTLLAAALFQPLRRRIQRAMDHWFDRTRYDGERTATAFGERLRNEVDLAAVETDFRDTVTRALLPSSSTVWIRRSSAGSR